MKPLKKKFHYGNHEIILETGQIARQSNSAVLVNMEGTTVLTTVVAKDDGQSRDFFPLTVNYQEKAYAAGKIPGGFFKREGRPAEKETLTSRLIDRPIRPLFPKEFTHEVQVICTVMSLNCEVDADIASLIGASAALKISGVPFQGPLGAARVGYNNGSYILNPSKTELETSELDLMVAGTKDGVLMVESEAKMLTEDVMLGAVSFGHNEMQSLISEINSFAEEFGVKNYGWVKPENENESLEKEVYDNFEIGLLPSNNALKNFKAFELECLSISNLLHMKIVKVLFQEGLKKISQDYKNSLSLDNANDFSMGYIDAFGYRASTCSSFFFYDLSNEAKTNLLLTPFVAHHKLIDKTSLSEVIGKIHKFKEIAKKYYGSFSVILSNEIFENSVKNSKRRFRFISLIKNIDNGF